VQDFSRSCSFAPKADDGSRTRDLRLGKPKVDDGTRYPSGAEAVLSGRLGPAVARHTGRRSHACASGAPFTDKPGQARVNASHAGLGEEGKCGRPQVWIRS